MRLKQSSVTTSSSLPRISEILPAIHLWSTVRSVLSQKLQRMEWAVDALFHDLQVDFLHINLLVELGWELRALEELRVDTGRHGCQSLGCTEL